MMILGGLDFWLTKNVLGASINSHSLLNNPCVNISHLHLVEEFVDVLFNLCVATPLWPSVGVNPNTSKVGDLESSGTPECSEFDNKAQNTLRWGVLSVIEKVLKRRYRKWPRIGHLDICSPGYGQKKGRKSNLAV
jgi:hypothetical protein